MLHDEVGSSEVIGHGAGMLSFKSHWKLTPEELSNTKSDGKLDKRHPDSTSKNTPSQKIVDQRDCTRT